MRWRVQTAISFDPKGVQGTNTVVFGKAKAERNKACNLLYSRPQVESLKSCVGQQPLPLLVPLWPLVRCELRTPNAPYIAKSRGKHKPHDDGSRLLSFYRDVSEESDNYEERAGPRTGAHPAATSQKEKPRRCPRNGRKSDQNPAALQLVTQRNHHPSLRLVI